MSHSEDFATRFEFAVGDYTFDVCCNGRVFVRSSAPHLDDGTKASSVRGFADLCEAILAVLPCKVPTPSTP